MGILHVIEPREPSKPDSCYAMLSRFFPMRILQKMMATPTIITPSAQGIVVAARTQCMPIGASAAVMVGYFGMRTDSVLVAALRFKSKDLAHDRRPFGAMRRDAMAMQTISNQVADLVRNCVNQEIFGILLKQQTVEADRIVNDVCCGRGHAAKFKTETRTLKAALIIIFSMAITIFDRHM